MNAFVIDAFEFCRLKEGREGEITVADLPRLSEESVDKSGALRWSLKGGNDSRGHPQLTLSISGGVRLMCQRCLTPFGFDIESESVVVLARDEVSADEIEALLADESVDVIVGSRAFNFAELIEDEALLAIPLSPKHEVCPDQAMPVAPKDVGKVSPFAVLKNLKK
ncbi:YceD family protein [Noviherbaspirillum autotrophicum]|uniref:Large ribosomal RNA subunit accumulation protein YceD n=1 Tax=Noviherbaspirillum autotrophicum TaxID=709839 RepID=A0A0C2BN30_9BURK|nr:YceD family protein [Noviherbaspirillum autotrophicum]KIF82675.1 DNA-binding protein [Noviherbaspirillum autotrophicum]